MLEHFARDQEVERPGEALIDLGDIEARLRMQKGGCVVEFPGEPCRISSPVAEPEAAEVAALREPRDGEALPKQPESKRMHDRAKARR